MSPTTKTYIFLGVLTGILVVFGLLVNGLTGAIFFLLIGIVLDVFAYFFSDRIALSSANATLVTKADAPEVYADLEELSNKFRIPAPKLYFSPENQANAFATGRDPAHSSICFTQGIMVQLNREQIRAVMAHELSHIQHRDVLIGTVAALLAGAIASLAQIGTFLNDDNEEVANPLVTILVTILSPIAGLLLQLAISRQREFAADYVSVKVTGRPKDLADALANIENSIDVIPANINPGFASLYISNPLKFRGIMELFSTHPSTQERIRRIMQIPV